MSDDTAKEKLAKFGAWVLQYHRENECCDIDGEDIQSKAIKLGLLAWEKRSKPCGEGYTCWCASYHHQNDWPVDCLRITDDVFEVIKNA